MIAGDRVALVCEPTWAGTIEKVRKDGRIDVTLDLGGRALGMAENDLVREEPKDKPKDDDKDRERERATSDKSWPPKGMETKVPNQTGQK